ncbi:uncharacterized protein GGS22DRAFT_151837 [Annulohypoxylon maeteangense]|uniref:uncharacterized protein n=1 Tax=Annulohypoxylon maeteangense TaxID=1927788 RepID=UPI002008213E|nr:uncharacterized protein GGS22DRAFT_151837 [Annulohypoxylon maeteangense]KAI0888561.1 hypothetical protein GGS22DRAFT_151837 [Annulohypoxylon maeteangense]
MGRPPAYIFIVRHGNRLDATDKQWHLSSPTPYDPPLTYGGWMQSKTVGARIASILQEREEYDEAEAEAEAAAADHKPDTASVKQKKRRYRVVIHSSPFLRCTQTSVAIAAGLASSSSVPAMVSVERSPSPRNTPSPPPNYVEKSVLRLDPFLGEWLSPDYFEHITPPPKSSLMLMTAKAELLRRENYNDYPHFHSRHAPNAPTQLWNASAGRGSPLATSMTPSSDVPSGLETLSALKGGLPKVSSESAGHLDPKAAHKVSSDPSWNPGYVAPVPSYALSTSEPIPKGYSAHARDACVNIDYQWDSSRDNLGWGEGGVLPEDWAAMHQRFRKGLCRLVEWYSTTENPGEMVTKTVSNPKSVHPPQKGGSSGGLAVSDDQEVEIEDVVVLVSHGAGCNALIGAITHQPVLIDVAMSSITLAQRKPEFDDGVNLKIYNGHASSVEEPLSTKRPTMSEMFELKLFANTEHLHSPMAAPIISRSSSSGSRNSHGRLNNGFSSALQDVNLAASLYGSPTLGSRSTSVNASLGSMRRGSPVLGSSIRPTVPNGTISGGITVGSGVSSFPSTRANRSGSIGLWTPPTQEDEVGMKVETPSLTIPKHEGGVPKGKVEASPKTQAHGSNSNNVESRESTDKVASKPDKLDSQSEHGEEHDSFDENAFPSLWPGTNNGGLWGSPRPPGEAERIRDFSSTKRRWTVNER